MSNKKQKVLLLGWDGADWKIINRLIDDGQMPVLKKLIEEGVMGNISTLEPAYSPMLWTTIATGKYPDKHGILGFIEPLPDHSGVRPVSTSSRKVKAVWNMLMQSGYKTHVFNWWPSHPAEPVNGIYVSNMFPKATSRDYEKWKLPNDAIHPPELKNMMAHFRVHPLELSPEHIAQFIPGIKQFSPKIMKKVEAVARLLAEASSVQAAASLSMEQEEWDFAAVYWDTIDHFCHAFMNYTPPQMKGVKDEDYELYNKVVDGAYRLMDLMLGHLLQLVDENCTVILLSDHGFKSGHLRSPYTPNEPAGPAHHHRNVGIFCAKGPAIKKDEIVYGASLLDITPTVLTIMGLPVGEDMDGKPLVEIFENPPHIQTIPTWENKEGNCGMLPDEKRDLDPVHSAEAIKQLIELGYIEDPGDDAKQAVEKTAEELDYNLAQVYYGTNRTHLAKPLFENLFNKYPHRGRYFFKLVECFMNEGDVDSTKSLVGHFRKSAEAKILSEEQIEYIKKRKIPEILNDKEKQKWYRENIMEPIKESRQAKNDLFNLKITEGNILFREGKPRKAIRKYREVEKEAPKTMAAYSKMGNAFLKLKQWHDAEKMFLNVLKSDPENENANLGMGISLYNQDKLENSLDYLLDAVSLNFYNAMAHFNVALVLNKMGSHKEAAQAFEIALKINPNFGMARNSLIELYEEKLDKPDKAKALLYGIPNNKTEGAEQTEKADELIIRPRAERFNSLPIIVVSGLPRSGTSMMMQMLDAAGVPVYTDENRKPDSSNPRGYFEHDKVKQLISNNSWLEEANGKAIKIVVPLLYKIPAAFNYKVIFMQRNLAEIVESQHRMLVENKKLKEGVYAAQIESTYEKYLSQLDAWEKRNKNVEVLRVNYAHALSNPQALAHKIEQFLGIEINHGQMTEVIDENLYRTKKE